MGKEKKTPIYIDDQEYTFEDLTQEQQALFNHCVDLDRKINSSQFNLDQLEVGRNAFMGMLKESLSQAPVVEEVSE